MSAPLPICQCVRLAPYDDARWVVVEPYEYVTRHVAPGTRIVVSAGFVTDLASVPRFFWRLIPPFGLHTNAAVVHDWLYAHRPHLLNKPDADGVFLEIMERDGVPAARREQMYRAVDLWGYSAYFSGKAAARAALECSAHEAGGGATGGVTPLPVSGAGDEYQPKQKGVSGLGGGRAAGGPDAGGQPLAPAMGEEVAG